MWTLLGGLFMGWSLGANDAANVFGPTVEAGALRFRTAAFIASIFLIAGAVAMGTRGFATYEGLGAQTVVTSLVTMLAAGVTVTLMTLLGLPVSSTQAVVGALIGSGLAAGNVSLAPLLKISVSWVLTPIGGAAIAFTLMKLLKAFPNALPARFLARTRLLGGLLVLATCYSAFSLGANNVANVTGVYVSAGLLLPLHAAVLGGAAISLGMCTFSKRVIRTVGARLVQLDSVSALIVVLAQAATLNVYAIAGVPVSASQAVVGAVLGIGLAQGVQTVDIRVLRKILFGWVGTPAVAGALAVALGYVARWLAPLGS